MPSGEADAGDLGVRQAERTPGCSPATRILAGRCGGCHVVDGDRVGEGVHEAVRALGQVATTFTLRKSAEAALNLLDSHDADRQGRDRLSPRPGKNRGVRCLFHQLRHHVGVSDDHDRSTVRADSVRGGNSNSTPPASAIAVCRASRKFCSGRPTAASRIARTSASTERPCSAALPRRRAWVRSSSCRLVRVLTMASSDRNAGTPRALGAWRA